MAYTMTKTNFIAYAGKYIIFQHMFWHQRMMALLQFFLEILIRKFLIQDCLQCWIMHHFLDVHFLWIKGHEIMKMYKMVTDDSDFHIFHHNIHFIDTGLHNGLCKFSRNLLTLGNQNFSSFFIHNISCCCLVHKSSPNGKLLVELVAANLRKVVSLCIKEQRINKGCCTVYCWWFTRS